MLGRIPPKKQLKRTNNLLSHHIFNSNKVVLSPAILKARSGDNYSTSPSPHKHESLSPRKYKLKKTQSKLFRKARQTDQGQTFLTAKTTIQKSPSSAKVTIYREKPRLNSKEHRQNRLSISCAYNICINGAPTLSQIIHQFQEVVEYTLPKIIQMSDDMLQIHSKIQQTPNYLAFS